MVIDFIQVHYRKICYQSKGDPTHPCVLFINGLASQLIHWPERWIDQFVQAGLCVITFDNRDAGQSTCYDDLDTPSIATAFQIKHDHTPYTPPYTFDAMAEDTAILLEALHIPKAHIIGISMRGMIAQKFALKYPGKLLSLMLLCTTSNAPDLSKPQPEILLFFSNITPEKPCREKTIQKYVQQYQLYQPHEQHDLDALRSRIEKAYDRAYHPNGTTRQMLATLFTPDWHQNLHTIQHPTLIIHGGVGPVFAIDHADHLA